MEKMTSPRIKHWIKSYIAWKNCILAEYDLGAVLQKKTLSSKLSRQCSDQMTWVTMARKKKEACAVCRSLDYTSTCSDSDRHQLQ